MAKKISKEDLNFEAWEESDRDDSMFSAEAVNNQVGAPVRLAYALLFKTPAELEASIRKDLEEDDDMKITVEIINFLYESVGAIEGVLDVVKAAHARMLLVAGHVAGASFPEP